MDFSTASEKERQKVQLLTSTLSKKLVNKSTNIELYQDKEVIPAEIVKRFDQGIVKYFLVSPAGTVKAGYIESLWEKELHKWTWGSREANIKP